VTTAWPDALTITEWTDPLVDRATWVRLDSNEALFWWTPILGPSAILIAHRFASALADIDRVLWQSDDLAGTFGLSNATLTRTLDRLVKFGVIHSPWTGLIEARRWMPPMTARHIERLPAYMQRIAQEASR
jgi:hypothetical protein